ncbi:hypothetical protein N7476_005080 [Penicillium atrosanguineum]|uniref:Tc1-like transposase DDE domain-containing protein n=1 Tax=Penicillium atrosanguineum TaxID=1132637 RepID=A0A9W9Q1Y5_9EURO|nr:hypothetical protein N7476_005080 [Penicillium atrosanguineum]
MPPIRSGRYVNNQYDTPSRASNVAQRSPRYQLAPYERAKLVELKAIGWSYKDIHERYSHIPIGTIKTTISRSRQRGPTEEILPRSGRPKALNDEERTMLLDLIRDDPHIKYDDLLSRLDHKVSRQTLWRFFRGFNKRKWLVLQRPGLSEEYAQKRRAWADRVRDYDSNKWRKIFFSDESTVERGKGARREYTFTRPADQIKERDIDPMFWAAFSGSGRRTGLIPLFGSPNAPRGGVNRMVILDLYQRVLPTLLNGIEGAIFQQDNAPVHTARIVREWLADQDFEVMAWPPYSPDLNPIENLWALLKAKIYEMHPEIKEMADNEETLGILINAAQEAWSELDTDTLDNLAITMPNRVKQVIDNEGWYTSY